LIAANGIGNPDLVFVGQVLSNPNCGGGTYGLGAAPVEPYADSYASADYAAADYAEADYAAADYASGYDAAGYGEMGAGYGDETYADYPAGDYAESGYADAGYGTGEMPAAARLDSSYTVQAGDNLSMIAAQYGVAVDEMLAVNGLQNPNIIYVGQQLVIP
jgi:nucleoid-associated protein YgaU